MAISYTIERFLVSGCRICQCRAFATVDLSSNVSIEVQFVVDGIVRLGEEISEREDTMDSNSG